MWCITLATTDASEEKIARVLEPTREAKRQQQLAAELQQKREQTLRQGSALSLEADCTEPGYAFCYVCLAKGQWTIPKNAFLEYDILIPYNSIRSSGGVDLTGGTVGTARDSGLGLHPSHSNDSRGVWQHFRYDLAPLAGKSFLQVVLATDGSNCPKGHYAAFFKNIQITDAAGRGLITWPEDAPARAEIAMNGGAKGMANGSIKSVPAASAVTAPPPRALVMHDGVAREDFSSYPDGSDGTPTWNITDGTWTVVNHQFVGSNSAAKMGWIAIGANAGDRYWTDYRLSLRFKVVERGSDWRDGPWVGFRSSCGGMWKYSLNFHGRDIALHKANRGRSTNDQNPLAAVPWKPDQEWHNVVISASGAHIVIELDGHALMDVRDNDYLGVPPLSGGGITLCARRSGRSTGQTTVIFADVEVREIKP